MMVPYDAPLCRFGEIWIGSRHGNWREKYEVSGDFCTHGRDAWELFMQKRMRLLTPEITILGYRGPFDEKWTGLNPDADPSVTLAG